MATLPIINPMLQTRFPSPQWKGNPLDARGRFQNHEFPFNPSFKEVWKWQTGPKPLKAEKKLDRWKPDIDASGQFLQGDEDTLVWLGHASFYLRIQGIHVLIDPILGDINFLVRRLVPFPVDPQQLPAMDYIFISHDHRDHLDEKSLRALSKTQPNATWLTGMGIAPLIRKFTGSSRIQEAAWYQRFDTGADGLELWYLPSRHWGRRGLTDTNARLWGSLWIQAGGKSLYWGGDSGYGSHFQEVQQLFGVPDWAILGIGAYQPEWFMHPSHMSPGDAVKALHDLGSAHFVPMHHGTYDLSDEPTGDPVRKINEMDQRGHIKAQVYLPAIGEKLRL